MDLTKIKTLAQISEETGILADTLKRRLDLKSLNLIEGVDYRKLGHRQPTILSPEGVKKISVKLGKE